MNDTESVSKTLSKWVLKALFAVLLCGFSPFALASTGDSEQEISQSIADAPSTELSVLTYNVQLLPRTLAPFTKFMRVGQKLRTPWIIEYLRDDTDYDVIVLQEVFAKPLCRKITKALTEKYPYQIKPKKRKGSLMPQGSGLLILSKYPIIEQERLFFRNGVRFEWAATKGATWARIEKDGVRFQIIGTHLQSQHHELAQSERMHQLSKIAELAARHEKSDEPLIFAGDFNVPRSHEEWYTDFLSVLEAEVHELDDPSPFTFDVSNHWIDGKYYMHEQLDYILYRNNQGSCIFREQEIIRPRILHKGEQIDVADHYGLHAQFVISNSRK